MGQGGEVEGAGVASWTKDDLRWIGSGESRRQIFPLPERGNSSAGTRASKKIALRQLPPARPNGDEKRRSDSLPATPSKGGGPGSLAFVLAETTQAAAQGSGNAASPRQRSLSESSKDLVGALQGLQHEERPAAVRPYQAEDVSEIVPAQFIPANKRPEEEGTRTLRNAPGKPPVHPTSQGHSHHHPHSHAPPSKSNFAHSQGFRSSSGHLHDLRSGSGGQTERSSTSRRSSIQSRTSQASMWVSAVHQPWPVHLPFLPLCSISVCNLQYFLNNACMWKWVAHTH